METALCRDSEVHKQGKNTPFSTHPRTQTTAVVQALIMSRQDRADHTPGLQTKLQKDLL
jgi:hypothetical protein